METSLNAFCDFFKDLGGNVFDKRNDEAESFNEDNGFNLPN